MASKVSMAFEPTGVTIPLEKVLPLKALPGNIRTTQRYMRIKASMGPVRIFVSASRLGLCIVGYPLTSGMRSSNMIAKWFKAAFQLRIGIFHFFDASLIAR